MIGALVGLSKAGANRPTAVIRDRWLDFFKADKSEAEPYLAPSLPRLRCAGAQNRLLSGSCRLLIFVFLSVVNNRFLAERSTG